MTLPRATYRLQFREGMNFERAAQIVPYVADLGISHLYASPIFTAAPGSTHGYDVADHQQLDPVLGGEEGFARLAEALREHGLGLLLDIVPNHMAVSTANPWWRDVLKYGRESRYAHHFDINLEAPRLLLPVLGEPYGEALAGGRLELRLDDGTGEPVFCYYGLSLPLAPYSVSLIPGKEGLSPQTLARVNADKELLHRIHEAQVWRLAYWRLAREALTYRRFFEISDLVGVRVEDAKVFADVHELPLRLVRDGVVDGLRIDHIDGLADPKGYLAQLRAASGVDHIWVEKILGPDEALRPDWPCAGTTGYEIASLIAGLQVDRRHRAAMTDAWTRFTGGDPDFARQVLETKRRILTVNLAGELDALVRLSHEIAMEDIATRDFGCDALRRAIVELAAALPVYRTYIDAAGAAAEDRALLAEAGSRVQQGREVEDDRVTAFILSLLLEPQTGSASRAAFVFRFQQTTGPLMAKAVEDTVFYRYNGLIALNEVGAAPDAFGLEPEAFHAAMERRAERWPRALSATATHDTKRGEDARARLAVLSEMPQEWAAAVARWHDAAEALHHDLPDADAEWLFYQALAGAWPADLQIEDENDLQGLCERLVAFMIKALREAKRRTSWTDSDEPYEAAVEAYVRAVFTPEHRELLRDIRSTIASIEPAGIVNSLAQLALKLTLPGIPDIYQGCELLDFSMVDPDNRRPVDFGLRRRLLAEARHATAAEVLQRWREGLPKMWLLDRLLGLRRSHADLFHSGDYEPVELTGDMAPHAFAYARVLDPQRILVAVPRLVLRHCETGRPSLTSGAFARTRLRLPAGRFRSLTGEVIREREAVLSDLWRSFPVAVLVSG
ncbi:malto-oligosyltrehalose synthase [Mesorhizobium sp. RMAD-H1]|uniref:malto-oligosyltrehalose synthase n=1 Tax=Mesorhizobium sp. RMAD-H1 TaxID=2587065 RepID=UPI0016094F7C|nr:malto-oligosyltrehalose synthase [Mesorhizobium sp. RMAD-H1]MBB2969902.1 (1->4)-alpha-D-glucan 1-alpha-D-glucosylmutase [Mesorhizobium sp. RMAD-H1]